MHNIMPVHYAQPVCCLMHHNCINYAMILHGSCQQFQAQPHCCWRAGSCSPKGRALVLAPYFTEFTSKGGDESADIAAALTAAGYSVTLKCNSPSACPAGAPTLEDYKGWGQYVAVVLVSHGDAYDDGSDPVVFTGVQYSQLAGSAKSAAEDDWLHGRVQLLAADTTLLLTPEWFNTYSNQVLGSVIYFSVCR